MVIGDIISYTPKDGETMNFEVFEITEITPGDLGGGYSIDAGLLPEDLTVTGYIGNDGDTLIFTAPLSFAGNNLTINDFLLGQDTRSTLNLFWYDNSNPNQQRMVISEFNMEAVAVSAGLSFTFEEIPEPEYGYVKVIKTSAKTNIPISGVVFGIYDDGWRFGLRTCDCCRRYGNKRSSAFRRL